MKTKSKSAKTRKATKPATDPTSRVHPLEDSTCAPIAETVSSPQSPALQPVTQPAEPAGAPKTMDLTLTLKPGARKSERLVIFDIDGRAGSVQFLRSAFGDTVPTTVTMSGDFADAKAAKEARVKETKEQRKARLAAETPADKIARAEARIAALKAKLAKAEAGVF